MRPPATTTQASRQTLAACLYSLRPRSRRRPSRTTDRLSPASGPATTEAVSSPLLRHGVALAQGPRDEMEDFVSVIPRALCGYMFAGIGERERWFCVTRENAVWQYDELEPKRREGTKAESNTTREKDVGRAGME